MLSVGELSGRAGVPRRTIRYYESIDLLPRPSRAENGYRQYGEEDVRRLHFVRSARALDFTLDDIREILAFRDREEPPCGYVLNLMKLQMEVIEERIADLQRLRADLDRLYEAGRRLPEDVQMRSCVCHLIEAVPEQA